MSNLLVRNTELDSSGLRLKITPQSAGWKYVGFELYHLEPGQEISQETGDREYCLVLVSGTADIHAGGEKYENIGNRSGAFDYIAPGAAYIPNDLNWRVIAKNKVVLAVCSAPGGTPSLPPCVITEEEMSVETRGEAANKRFVRNILHDGDTKAHSLLVVEVITPAGNWSSYPPHKHDQNDLPNETYLEETYYHRLNPSQGFGFQRVYTDDRSLDETIAFGDGDAVCVPKGYHPVGAPYGYESYYLNVMAGPIRKWVFKNDPDHEWLMKIK